MPKRATAQIAHSALTNHRILARPNEPLPPNDEASHFADLPGIVYVNGPAGQTVSRLPLLTRLTAYGELSAQQPQLGAEYLKLLQQAETELPQEPLVRAALGRKALREQHFDEAIRFLSSATTPDSVLDLAKALKLAGRESESAAALEHVISLSPLDKTLRKTLILTYIDLKRYDVAKAAMQDYIATFPEDSFMRGLLSKVAPAQ